MRAGSIPVTRTIGDVTERLRGLVGSEVRVKAPVGSSPTVSALEGWQSWPIAPVSKAVRGNSHTGSNPVPSANESPARKWVSAPTLGPTTRAG